MNKHIDCNIKLNPQIMSNVRMRKSAFFTLCRGGLICLLFLMPWFSNLQAQHLGTVGIDPNPVNQKATLNILDDDNYNNPTNEAGRLRRKIKVVPVTESVTEGGNLTFKVAFTDNRTTAVKDVNVTYKINDGTATGGGIDFNGDVGVEKTITILSGQNESSIVTISTIDDNIIEGDEKFSIMLDTATSVGDIPSRENALVATVFDVVKTPYEFTILDNDNNAADLKLEFYPTTYSITEGTGATSKAQVKVRLATGKKAGEDIIIPYDILATSSAALADYTITPTGETIKILEGQSEGYFEIQAKEDNVLELKEHVHIQGSTTITSSLGLAYGWSSDAKKKADIEILDATGSNPGNLKLSIAATPVAIDEGAILPVNVKVSLPTDGDSNQITSSYPIEVTLDFAGSTANPPGHPQVDYTFSPALTGGNKLTIPAGQNFVEVKLNALADDFVENPETVVMKGTTITGGSGYSYDWAVNTATVTINDKTGSTDPDKKKLVITASPTSIQEGGQATITVKFNDINIKTQAELPINILLTGDAAILTDYDFTGYAPVGTTLTVKIPALNNSVTFKLNAKDDEIIELSEKVILSGQAVAGHSWLTDKAEVTITDKTGTIATKTIMAITPLAVDVEEGSSTDITVSLPATTEVATGVVIKVPLKIGTSTANPPGHLSGEDYTLSQSIYPRGEVKIIGPAKSATVTLNAIADGIAEPSETVRIESDGVPESTDAGTYSWHGTDNNSVVTIKDKSDASALKIIIDIDKTSIKRSPGTEEVIITARTANGNKLGENITITLANTGTATGTDFNYVGGSTITIPNTSDRATTKVVSQCQDAGAKTIILGATTDTGGIAGLTTEFGVNGATITIEELGIGADIIGPSPATTCHNTAVTLTAPAAPANSTYKWRDGAAIVGSNSSTYVLPDDATVGMHNITVDITTPEGCLVNKIFDIEVLSSPKAFTVATTTPGICGDSKATITSTVEADYAYQWWREKPNGDTELIIGAIASTLNINETVPGIYKYTLRATDNVSGCVRTSSNSAIVEFIDSATIPDPSIKVVPTGGSLCGGGAILEALTIGGEKYGAGTRFEWYKDGNTVHHKISGQENAILNVQAPGVYYVIAYVGTCPSSVSAGATIVGPLVPNGIPTPVISPSATPQEVCGESLELRVSSPADLSTYKVRWYNESGYIAIAGSSRTYSAPADGSTYRVILTDIGGTCASAESNTVTVKTKGTAISVDQPIVEVKPASKTSVCGGAVVLTVTNHLIGGNPDPAVTFQWYKVGTGVNDDILSGKTERTLILSTPTESGTYYVVAKKNNADCGAVATSVASIYETITITNEARSLADAKLISVSGSTVVCEGGSLVLKVTLNDNVTDYPELNAKFHWYKNGFEFKETAANILAVEEDGTYQVVVERTNTSCAGEQTATNQLLITVGGAIGADLAQPVIKKDETAGGCVGGTVTLYVVNPIPTGITYQWYNEQGDIPDGTGAFYIAETDGYHYVIASDGTCSSKPSNSELVTLSGAGIVPSTPHISVTSNTYCEGGNTILYIANLGSYTENVEFQWLSKSKGVVGIGGVDYKDNILIIPIGIYGEDIYSVVARDKGCQSLSSVEIPISKAGGLAGDIPELVIEGSDILCIGGSVTLTVSNYGSYPSNAVYKWYNTSNLATPVYSGNIPSFHTYYAQSAGRYLVTVEEVMGCPVASNIVEVKEGNPISPELSQPKITSSPANGKICIGAATSGSVELKASKLDGSAYSTDVTYIWYKDGTNVTSTVGSGSVIVLHLGDEGDYVVKVKSSDCESKVSAVCAVRTDAGNSAPDKPILDPMFGTIYSGGSIDIKATNIALNDLVQWYEVASDGVTLAPLGDPTGNVYRAEKKGYYAAVAISGVNGCRSKLSEIARIDEGVGDAPEQPIIEHASNTICVNGSVELKAVPKDSGAAPYPANTIYMWYLNNLSIPGADKAIYQVSKPGSYTVKVKIDGRESAVSDPVVLTFGGSNAPAKPGIIAVTPGAELCVNGSVSLRAVTEGTSNPYPSASVKFWWYKGGLKVGITDDNVFHYEWQSEDNGKSVLTFTVKVVDGSCESAESQPGVNVNLSGNTSISERPIIEASNGGQLCVGGSVTLSVTNMTGTSYEWYKVGSVNNPVKTTNAPTYTVNTDGDYYVIVVNGASCRTKPSDPATSVVTNPGSTAPVRTLTISPTNITVCLGGDLPLTVSGGVANDTYRWFFEYSKDGITTVETVETKLITIMLPSTNKGNVNAYVVVVDGGCQSMQSNSAAITIDTNTSAIKPSIDSDWKGGYCEGTKVVLRANVGSLIGVTSYTWYKDGIQIPGATTDTYEASSAGKYTVLIDGPTICMAMSAVHDLVAVNDPSCFSSLLTLSVDNETISEGDLNRIWTKLPTGLKAKAETKIQLSFAGSATRSTACANGGSNDYYIDNTLLQITIPQDQSEGFVTMHTCLDLAYEGKEEIAISAVNVADSKSISNSPLTVTLLDKDADADGKLTLAWELVPTTYSATGRLDAVYKGEPIQFKLKAVAQDGVTLITVQNKEDVRLTYNPSSTAHPGDHYTAVLDATIPAGDSVTTVTITTINNNVVDLNDLNLITDIQTEHNRKNPAQVVYIASKGVNPLGGYDFKVTLEPNEVIEGESFTLTVELDVDPQAVLGSDVVFTLSQGSTSIAQLGVDYNLPEVKLYQNDHSRKFLITTIDNDIYDGRRRMDIEIKPVGAAHQIVSMLPSPLSGVIKDNDKLCLTITSDLKGIDDLETTANVTVTARNLAATAGGIVVQLHNQNYGTMDKYHQPVSEFSIPFTLTSANPVHEFKVISTLQPPTEQVKKEFKINEYPTIHDTMIIVIQNISVADLDCYAPVGIIISDDFDDDGLPNWLERGNPSCEGSGDSNGNGILNEWDPYDPNADDDKDGIPNWMEDTNRDGNPYNDFASLINCLPNFANPDSDNDGVPDTAEKWTNRPYDDNEGDIRIHPALSLNDDGIGNDFLFIENIEKYPGSKVTVFDRQGSVVFEGNDYNNTPDKAFRGIANKGKTGKKIPIGTYFVIVEYTKNGSKKYYDKAVEVRY